MQKLVVLLLGLWVFNAFAGDRDTIPLGKKTSGTKENSIIAPTGKTTPSQTVQKIEAQPATTPKSEEGLERPYVASVETYGSDRINEVILRETLGSELDQWLKRGLEGDPDSLKLEAKLVEKVQRKFKFALAEWSVVQYFEPGDLAIHITLDVVEPSEVGTRMNFMAAPTGQYTDPEGLIKNWMEYEELALDMVESGELEPEAEKCVAFHCPFGHKHAKLQKYEKIFVTGVNKYSKEILQIQKDDKRAEYRAAASYLLAYLKDGKKVVASMVDRIRDQDATVRNNALRVLGDIAEFNPELVIPIKPVIDAFQYPRVSDRSKAVYLAFLLSMNSAQAREEMMKHSIPTLLQMLASKQPDQRDLSHSILRKLSGREYPNNDVLAWTNWFNRLAKERSVSKR